MTKTYSELLSLHSFKERLDYLSLEGSVGNETFGSHRYLNQRLYSSVEWKRIRDSIILRDQGCDLAHIDFPIGGRIYIHHINPITENALVHGYSSITDPENLVCVSFYTHNAIHYGDISLVDDLPIHREKNDMIPWRS